jgi:superfamily II DNA or RNA helicase
LIGDEVHGLGATDRKKGLLEKFNYRLGLSATPTRWFDEEGTDFLLSYFRGVVFQYDIDKAIKNGFLCPYEYIPYFATMNSEEMETYYNLTKSLAKSYYSSKNEKERKNLFNFYAIQRQKVIVNSQEKYSCFTSIIDSLDDPDHCLVYCSPEQIDNVQKILLEKEFIQHRFTFDEDLKNRQELLKNFDKGQYKILVAIKCLDEGVDIPSTKIAIILASSTNPREYIQRRGRILRTYPGKEKASIFDVIVLPNVAFLKDSALYELEKKIVRKEIQRYIEFAKSSINPGLAYSKILDTLSLYNIRLEEFI